MGLYGYHALLELLYKAGDGCTNLLSSVSPGADTNGLCVQSVDRLCVFPAASRKKLQTWCPSSDISQQGRIVFSLTTGGSRFWTCSVGSLAQAFTPKESVLGMWPSAGNENLAQASWQRTRPGLVSGQSSSLAVFQPPRLTNGASVAF